MNQTHFDALLGRRPVRMSSYLAVHGLDDQAAASLPPLVNVTTANAAVPKKARLGMVVPKRHAKRAVWRNAIKRQVRESFRLSGPDSGLWLVRLRGPVTPWSSARASELRAQLDALWLAIAQRRS